MYIFDFSIQGTVLCMAHRLVFACMIFHTEAMIVHGGMHKMVEYMSTQHLQTHTRLYYFIELIEEAIVAKL